MLLQIGKEGCGYTRLDPDYQKNTGEEYSRCELNRHYDVRCKYLIDIPIYENEESEGVFVQRCNRPTRRGRT